MCQYVGFVLDEQVYCLDLSNVERVVHVVEMPPLPKAPDVVTGILNLNGEIIPVVNIRKRFNLPEKAVNLRDQLIIARTAKRKVAILADVVTGVIEILPEQMVASEKILPGSAYVAGVIKLPDGMVLIHDLDTLLSLEEEKALDSAVIYLKGKS